MKLKRILPIITALSIIAYTFIPVQYAAALSVSPSQHGGGIVQSMLPLEEKKAYIVVGDHDGVDISKVPVELVLDNLLDSSGNHIEINENAKVVWSYYKDKHNNIISDDYFVLEKGGTLDLSLFEEYDQYTLEMIVGDGNQLNPDNIRYIVTVYLSDTITELRTYELYTQDSDGTRHKVEPKDVCVQGSVYEIAGVRYSLRQFLVPEHVEGMEYYLSVNSPLDEHPFIKLDVVSFEEYYKYMQAQALGQEYTYTTINDQILYQNMNIPDAGYKDTWSKDNATIIGANLQNALYFIYRDQATGEILAQDSIKIIVDNSASYFNDEAYTYFDDQWQDIKLDSEMKIAELSDVQLVGDRLVGADALQVNRVWLKKGYSPDEEYYYRLDAKSRIWDNANDHVVKAVVGAYDSLASAADADDIKEQLLPSVLNDSSHGYKANYNIDNGGMIFTVFFDDNTSFKFLVLFYEYDPQLDSDYIREYSNVPIIGEADPWFRITGANDVNGEILDTYIIENGKSINVDTMYGYGYQSVFINENIDSFVPTFWLANSELISVESIYVNGRRFNVGDSISFADSGSSLNALFSVIINDGNGRHTKNYNISFVKKAVGGQIYVAGPVNPDVRSVFLDEYFEYKHDIFIANIGDTALTNLRLELDAENVTLDPYWTIGGDGNDTLAPCPNNFKVELLSTNYGEISNVAKIRLIPDGESSGEIDGVLKIYSGSELLTTINLSGRAQNPEILTTDIDDAVLYVPYSYLITTNNMYDWTNVDFSISGKLPDGVKFYPETGEIYGVPLETGTFEFDVTANFTSDTYSFDSSTVSLTLTVKDNTNYNVYNATDMDYTLLDSIGTDVGEYDFVLTEYNDELFRSEGVLEQFVGLWLNGELLEEGIDYEAESGSTKITIYAQTFENKAEQNGINTIAAEFRTTDVNDLNTSGNTNELRRTAQNFRLDIEREETTDITCSIRLYDPSGDILSGVSLELRSTPQYAITNAAGIAYFNPIEFGSHTLYAKDSNGKITAQKSFNIVSGSGYSVKGNTITAVKGSSITFDVRYDGKNLTLLSDGSTSTQNGGVSDPDKQTSSPGNSVSGDNNNGTVSVTNNNTATSSNSTSAPDTGDDFHLWLYVCLIILSSVAILTSVRCKKLTSGRNNSDL